MCGYMRGCDACLFLCGYVERVDRIGLEGYLMYDKLKKKT